MSWKNAVNALLGRSTGYVLTRQTAGPARDAAGSQDRPADPPRPARRAPRQDPEHKDPERKAPQRKAPDRKAPTELKLPAHFDDDMKEIIRTVRPRTMTSPQKLSGLILAARYVAQHDIPGDIVECGVWRGGSMQAAALALSKSGQTHRHLHLFDTFEGMPPPGENDRRHDGSMARDLLAARDRDHAVWAIADLDDVRAGMAELDYPQDRIHYHPGMVEDTIPGDAPESISILRLDTDWYESTRHELEHLYDRLSPGGVLIIDDYGHWEGSRRATEEFLSRTGEPLLLLPLASGRIAVKPFK